MGGPREDIRGLIITGTAGRGKKRTGPLGFQNLLIGTPRARRGRSKGTGWG